MHTVPLRYVPISPFIDESERMQAFLDALGQLLEPPLAVDHARLCIRRLLEFCGRTRVDGKLGSMSARRLAEAIGWRLGEPGDFLAAALQSGWLIATSDGLAVEGWERHGGKVLAQRAAWATSKAEQRERAAERRERNRDAKRRQRARGCEEVKQASTAAKANDPVGQREWTCSGQSDDSSPIPNDQGRTVPPVPQAYVAAEARSPQDLAEATGLGGCPDGQSVKNKFELKLLAFQDEEVANASPSAKHTPRSATSILAPSQVADLIASITGESKLADRHWHSLQRVGPISDTALDVAAKKAALICSDSKSKLTSGLIVSCLERAKVPPTEMSRIAKTWQRGLEALLIPDADQSL